MPEALRVRPDDVEIGIPELWTDGGTYESRIDRLRADRWLYSTGNRTDSDGVENFHYRSWWSAPSPAARARADEIIAAWEKWQKRINRKPRGYRAAERAHLAADSRVWDLQRKIFKTQAHTLAGLRAKATVIDLDHSDDESTFLCALARDILAMTTA
jgi:hypothetical protein